MTLKGLRKTSIGLAALLVTIVVPLYAVKVDRKHDYTDFEVYYRAAKRVQAGQWDQIYNLGDGASPFRYAPPLLPLFRPFAELSLPHARMSWYFLQVLWFALGFFCIERALRLTRVGHGRKNLAAPSSLWITSVALLFTLRFCLDCFTIGQVSSLLFLGYCASLYAWMARKPGVAGSALLVPSVFKIGPGFLFSFFAASHKTSDRVRALGAPLLWLLAATAFLRIWAGGGLARFKSLWYDWTQIVLGDSTYYDASHYGSQSIKSAILRAVNSGWITAMHAQALYLSVVVFGCLAVLFFWASRRPRSSLGRGLFFALGIFPYLWFMPETFKYSLTALAIPVALLLAAPRKDRLTWFALGFGALTLSVAGLDIIGSKLFFGMQRASVPLMATLLLGLVVWREALRESRPILRPEEKALGPWAQLPITHATCQVSVILPLPLQSHTTLPVSWVRQQLEQTLLHFQKRAESFEILIAPFGDCVSEFQPSWLEAQRFVRESSNQSVRIELLPPADFFGRGGALRQAFLASRGERLACINLEQPCEFSFYDRAEKLLTAREAQIVRANRRLPESRFRIPVKFLSLVYGRHRLGLYFNQMVRAVLPIRTTDTHSGSWCMSRSAATAVFALQRTPGFLFDLEISLIASANGLIEKDLPVLLHLSQEKNVKRVGSETLSILRGLPMLAARYRKGCYHPQVENRGITADDWGLTPGVNQGILELARLGIVRRVSMMAYGAYLQEGLSELQTIPGIRLGLHFDLTYGKASPGQILLKWLKPGTDRVHLTAEVRKEFDTQLTILRSAGVHIDYLDGHHHIHLVPGIMDTLAPAIRAAGIREVRLPLDRTLITSKISLVALAWFARSSFRRHGFESLNCFYPQARHFDDQGLFRARLGADPAAEVIVHPASRDDLREFKIPDPYAAERVTEYRALRMLTVGRTSDASLEPFTP